MIEDEDISIVVQGPILKRSIYNITDNLTEMNCLRLKKLFPKSELILSTWEGEDVKGIVCDKVIFSKDPGATWFEYGNDKLLNNCNRLIVSTLNGIRSSTRKYVLKVRSDLFLVSNAFLKYFNKFDLYNKESKFVKSRIIAFSLNTLYGHRNKLFTMYRPYHISDWAYFGYREDLLNLYDIDLTKEPEFSQWFLTRCKPFFDIEPKRLWKMPPEQYITYSFLKKHVPIHLEHTVDTSQDNIALSQKLLVNNFLILDQTQFFLVSLKYIYFAFSSYHGNEWYISHGDWLKDYLKHVDMPSSIKKMQYKIESKIRTFFYPIFNKILRIVNGKNYRICRLCGYFIKKHIQKDNRGCTYDSR
jgi:hypothetical protein